MITPKKTPIPGGWKYGPIGKLTPRQRLWDRKKKDLRPPTKEERELIDEIWELLEILDDLDDLDETEWS